MRNYEANYVALAAEIKSAQRQFVDDFRQTSAAYAGLIGEAKNNFLEGLAMGETSTGCAGRCNDSMRRRNFRVAFWQHLSLESELSAKQRLVAKVAFRWRPAWVDDLHGYCEEMTDEDQLIGDLRDYQQWLSNHRNPTLEFIHTILALFSERPSDSFRG